MNCVAEIIVMRAKAETEYKAEQERLDRIAHEERRQNALKTIEYCETEINDFFVESAKSRKANPKFEIRGTIHEDRNGFEYICPLKKVQSKYADLRTEHRPNYEIKFDFATLVEYLSQFCYTVKVVEDDYWHYGWGNLISKKIIISLE